MLVLNGGQRRSFIHSLHTFSDGLVAVNGILISVIQPLRSKPSFGLYINVPSLPMSKIDRHTANPWSIILKLILVSPRCNCKEQSL